MMLYWVEISELALDGLAQEAEAEWLLKYCFSSWLISPANRLNKLAQSSTTLLMLLYYFSFLMRASTDVAARSVVP